MTELVKITLENEMDLTLAYKRSILTAGLLGLTVATQTAFATAVSEVCREVIDKATQGEAVLGTRNDSGRFFFCAHITALVDDNFDSRSEGFEYARKLVPVLEIRRQAEALEISLQLAIPRATRTDQRRISQIKRQIEADGPVSAYEEVKQRNAQLAGLNLQKDTELLHARLLNKQKSEFLSVASHELNSPLTILRSYTQIALKVGRDSEPALHNYLNKIDLQTSKLIRLVSQLMDVSKLEHGNITYDMQTLSANQILGQILEPVRLLVPTHKVELELGEDRTLYADELRLEQVLTNLVGNAAKYSAHGSLIKICTRAEGNNLTVTITDEGIGLSPEAQKQVFEKFYRDKKVENKISGLGVGLYITSRIITDHAGSIAVTSTEGKGSTFSFTLPVQN